MNSSPLGNCITGLLLLLGALAPTSPVYSQPVSLADYQRAQAFLWENVNNEKVFNLSLTSGYFPDSTGMWYVDRGPGKKDFYKISFDLLEKEPHFDQQRLGEALEKMLQDTVSPGNLPIDRIIYLSPDSLELFIRGKSYRLDLTNYTLHLKPEEEEEDNDLQSTSPDGKWIAYSENYNLFLKSTETGEVHQLSTDGAKNYEYGSYYGWADLIPDENGERPPQFSVDWSPDSKWLRADICDLRQAEKMYLLDYSVDTLYKPKLYSYYRGSPGDTTIVQMIPVFYQVGSRQEIPARLEKRGYVMDYDIRWIEGADEILIVDQERGYKKVDLFRLNLNTGKKELLFSEKSETNVDRVGAYLVESFDKLIFLSERSGWQHLYAYDFGSKRTIPLTSGDYMVHRTVHADRENGWIYFLASGRNASENPYFQYLYRVSINGGPVESLTPEPGNHQVDFSPDGRFFVDEYSTYRKPATFTLRQAATGKILTGLAETNIQGLLDLKWSPPEAFEAVGRDGKTTIYGALWKPTNFDPDQKYPIIDYSYTGPHTQVFPRRFEQVLYSGLQDMAELGFVIVKIDGMGTYGRSKAFHDISYKNMGKNLLDHVLAIRQLGGRFSWADTTRVGIFGHSAGGYDAGHAVLEFPDFYKVAVASSADHDFRMEKAWWPEMYMGWPVDSSYHQVSNITMAGNLKGKLLITHGGLDENVNPSATYKLAEALILADKEFDMLILPSQHHGYRGKHAIYFRKKRWNYFVEHLLGARPIWNIEAKN